IRRGARRGLVVRSAPAGERRDLAGRWIDDRLAGRRVALLVRLVVRRPEERDELLDLAVVERPGRVALIGPHWHLRVGVAADVATAEGQDVLQVRLVEVAEQLLLRVQLGADVADR